MLGEFNNSQTRKEEVQGAVQEMKAVGLDRCGVECLKSSSTSMTEWLVDC